MEPTHPYDQARDDYVPCVAADCPRHANVWMTFGGGADVAVERACYTHSVLARELHQHMVGALRLIDGIVL